MSQNDLDARYRKKVSQMVMLLAREKETGKIDWHSREHLARDALCVATATKHGGCKYENPEKSKR